MLILQSAVKRLFYNIERFFRLNLPNGIFYLTLKWLKRLNKKNFVLDGISFLTIVFGA